MRMRIVCTIQGHQSFMRGKKVGRCPKLPSSYPAIVLYLYRVCQPKCLGWKCCKPRVLTFDEFLAIEPCTTGKHSEVDETPAPEPVQAPEVPNDTPVSLGSLQESLPAPVPRLPTSQAATPRAGTPKPPEDSEDDDPSLEVKQGMTCRRKSCGVKFEGGEREGEKCVHHPGAPIFHEGSKGWSCCKRRVLEFDQFMNIEGCKTKERHLFVGSGKKDAEEKLDTVRWVSPPKSNTTKALPLTTA
jgi:hypothetical protein